MLNNIINIILYLRWYLQKILFHVEIGWQNGLYLHLYQFDQFLESKQNEYEKLSRDLERRDFIEYVLRDSMGFTFIIFLIPKINNYFVQFYRSKGGLNLDFPATSSNRHSFEKQKEVIKMLEEKGFKKNFTPSLNFKQYNIVKLKSGKTICANFQKDYNLASEFANTVFSRIFNTEEKADVRFFN